MESVVLAGNYLEQSNFDKYTCNKDRKARS